MKISLSHKINRGPYKGAHVLLHLLNELGEIKCEAWLAFYHFFSTSLKKFNNTRAQMLGSIYHMTLKLPLK